MKIGEYCVVIITMIVFLQFIGMPTGLSLIAESYGISINPATGTLISADIGGSSTFLRIFGLGTGLLAVLTLATVAIGFITKTFSPSLVILPLIVLTATTFIGTGWILILHVSNLNQAWATNLIATIFIGIGIAFAWSCVDYFVGR